MIEDYDLVHSETVNTRRNGVSSFPAHTDTDGGSRLAKLKTENTPQSGADRESRLMFPLDEIPVVIRGIRDEADYRKIFDRLVYTDIDILTHRLFTNDDMSKLVATVKIRRRLLAEDLTTRMLFAEKIRTIIAERAGVVMETPGVKYDQPYCQILSYNPNCVWDELAETPVHTNARSARFPFGSMEDLMDSVFIPCPGNEPPQQDPAVTWFGYELAPAGSIVTVVAPPGAGKSSSIEMIVESVVTGQTRLGFNFKPGTKVAVIDGERTDREVYLAFRNIQRRIGTNLEYGTIFGTINSDVNDRMTIAEALIEDGYNLLVFDGGTDLIKDPNDMKEANAVINEWLRPLLNRHGATAILTIHDNPDKTGVRSDKARGHFGSELMRRSSAVLNITNDRKTGGRKLSTDGAYGKFRHGDPNTAAYFQWDDSMKMMVEVDTPPAQAASVEKTLPDFDEIRIKLPRIFKGHPEGMGRNQIVPRIQSVFADKFKISREKAEALLLDMLADGLLKKSGKDGTRSVRYHIQTVDEDDD